MTNRSYFLEKNMRFEGECVDMHHSGLGVVKYNNAVVLVKDLLIGELAIIHVLRVEKKLAYGKVEKLINQSPYRIPSICSVSSSCGGCPLITLSDEGQALMKQNIVKDQLNYHGLNHVTVLPIVQSPQRYHTRNKVAVPVQHDPFKMGFYRLNSHDIVEFDVCHVQTKTQNHILEIIRQYPNKDELRSVKHIVLKENHNQTQMIVGFVVYESTILKTSALIDELFNLPYVVGVVAHINTSEGNAIFKGSDEILRGDNTIVDELHNLKFKLSLQSFYQINPHQTLRLYEIALDYAKCTSEDVLVDLYCGVGSISLLAASLVKHVVGVEINPIAIENAKENQSLNKIVNASFHVGDASEVTQILDELKLKADILIVDPPRSGLSSSVIQQIKDLGIPKVVYVSCNPMTLCANLKELQTHYSFDEVTPVDMFPNTRHCESVTLLSRKD
jgi:23S rRNA (uracil1939-C5)-methyltransferase